MSTRIPALSTEPAPPATRNDLRDYFLEAGKPRSAWRIGAEFEKIAVDRATGRQIAYAEPEGVERVLAALADRHGWEPHFEDRTGTRVFIAHGVNDPVIEVGFARRARDLIEDAGLELSYHESPVGHQIDPANIPLPAGWLGNNGQAAYVGLPDYFFSWSVFAQMNPYLEQTAIYNNMDLTQPIYLPPSSNVTAATHRYLPSGIPAAFIITIKAESEMM